jgi:hypothetical protein
MKFFKDVIQHIKNVFTSMNDLGVSLALIHLS